jgi:phosphoserine phosphatase RsbU/P
MRDPRLRVHDALGVRTVEVGRTPFTIGRRETNDLRLGGLEVSREHAEIVQEDGRYRLRDCQSRYGTFVGGERVTDCELRPGDQIRLGREGGASLVFLEPGRDDSSPSGEHTPNAREGLRQMTELLERLRALAAGRVLQDVLALVLDAALEIARAERGFIMLATPDDRLEFRLARGPGGQTLTDQTFQTSRLIPEEVFRTGITQVVRDLSDPGIASEHAKTRELGIRHIVCVALHLVQIRESPQPREEDRRIGVLYLDGHAKGTLVSVTTQSALETLAAEASLAIENARLYRDRLEKARLEHEMRVAAEIQRALLPQPVVRLAYVEAAASSIPCRAIGGDFYDYLGPASPVFGFSVGDVAGKGPPAALLSAMLQGMLAFASRGAHIDSPAAVIASINHALCQRVVEMRFVTLFFGLITTGGQLTYCNAGHNPPMLFGASGVRRLEAGGPIVGVLEQAIYDQGTIALAPGDTIVVFSDGVSEALNGAEEEFGEARLLETIRQTGTSDAPVLVDAIVDAVRRFAHGAEQSDDITVMAVRYLK